MNTMGRWTVASRLFSAENDLLNYYRPWTDVDGKIHNGVVQSITVDFKRRDYFQVTLLVDGDDGHVEKTITVRVGN